jgi:16S rRNA (uracil1498-N3)-methyltransferase
VKPLQRYFVSEENIKDDFITITEDYHHIVNVMRFKKGDEIVVTINSKSFKAEIIEIGKSYVLVKKKCVLNEEENDFDITLAQSLIRSEKFEFILQKATELGVKRIIPLRMERNVVKIDAQSERKKIERWKKILKEASEQTQRNTIPEIFLISEIEKIDLSEYNLRLVAYEKEKTINIKQVLQKSKKDDKIIIVIGPEGGITEAELEKLKNLNFIPVSLGNNILRSETAAIFAVSVIIYELFNK